MTDSATETQMKRRVPRDKFEAALMERVIRSEIASLGRHMEPSAEAAKGGDAEKAAFLKRYGYRMSVHEMTNEGEMELLVSEMKVHDYAPDAEFDWLDWGGKVLRGRVWVEEREHPVTEAYRYEVVWSLGSQTNYADGPVIDWTLPNPTGP